MTTSPIQEIKDRLDIVEFIRSYIPLTPAGKNFKALCPFHKEKTPSFMVSPERQTWHCFGSCNEGGDIFKFLMKYENLEFYEALKILAERAGVELRKISPADQKQFGILYEINEAAKKFFKKQLEQSPETLDYLKSRGLKKETIEEFEVGLAPDKFDELNNYLIKSGYSVKDIERAGLNFKTERGSYVDRFRGRIMFPLCNHFGKVVGFSGRILPRLESLKPELGKYVNTPETLIFNKSRILYGLHKTKRNIARQKTAVLVEGQMDFLMAYQDGIENAVATSGTALTPEHLKTIRRFSDELVFCFDNDEAGLNAAERAIDLANVNDFNVKLLVLDEFKDPAEAVQKSPGRLSGLVREAKPAMEFYFNKYQISGAAHQDDVGKLKKNIRIILAKIKNLVSAVERAHWLKQLSLKTKIEEKALAEEMEQIKLGNWPNGELVNSKIKTNQPISQLTNQASRRELICQRLISLVIVKEELKAKINDYLDYLPQDYLTILESLAKEAELEEKLCSLLNLISLRSSFESSTLGEEKLEEEFDELLYQLRMEYLREKRNGLAHLIKEAEEAGDEMKISSVLKEFSEISKSIQNI